MTELTRIDFQRSRLYWNHGSEKSHGAFRVESALTVRHKCGEIKASYALAAGVLAGNMYAPGRLVKDPIYYFQIAASNEEHVIFRTYTYSKRLSWKQRFKKTEHFDTRSKNHIFTSLCVDLKTESARQVDPTYKDIKQHYMEFGDFSCQIKIPLRNECIMELEFPVKHINILPGREMFQVETGPVLFVEPSWIANSQLDNDLLAKLVPSFVHFNQFDRADISVDFPYGVRNSSGRGKMLVAPVQCNINFLVNL